MSNPILTIMLEALVKEAARQHPIRVVQTASGGWDVTVRLDGTYTDRADAEASAEFLTGALIDAAEQQQQRALLPFSVAREAASAGSGVPDIILALGEQDDELA
ncbi:hypothetical protein [Gordonia sp. CPCC 205333]|uniref:hypothetical protein n=1 Tax=Gordonia sp. CPCC 205333 TaxID=3140790 RepID=UPI003AF3A06C